MSLSYKDLTRSMNKMSILLYRLTYPTQNTKEYWDRWAHQPIHEVVFTIIRGLAKHRLRIFQLQNEEEYIRQQYQQLANATMVEEDRVKISEFMKNEYRNLILAEKKEWEKQKKFLQQQINLVEQHLSHKSESEGDSWKRFYKEQIKFVSSEMKKLGLTNEFKQMRKELEGEE